MITSQITNEKILLRNLIQIRWIAIIGQFIAIIFVYFILRIEIPISYCLLIVFISILINLLSLFLKSTDKYLSDNEAFYFLLYDTSQLAILLYLTGGIYNPFSLLLIAPVIISASYLKIGYSIFLSLYSIIIVCLLSIFFVEISELKNFFSSKLFVYGLVISLIISIIFIAIYVYILAESSRAISKALNQTQIELINQKKFSEIGSIAAAAIHEFSTPLNTIFLILDDLKKAKLIGKNLKSDILLLESQANRCKEILLNLSKNPQYLKDTFFQKTTISNLIRINFEKFNKKNKKIKLHIALIKKESEPLINSSDEIMYGLGNIIQNAIEYTKSIIEVKLDWNKETINIKVLDDGKGFSNEILDKIGKPYISSKNSKNSMGLGIFIAKNLIENVDGAIKFSNSLDNHGSIVEILLKREI